MYNINKTYAHIKSEYKGQYYVSVKPYIFSSKIFKYSLKSESWKKSLKKIKGQYQLGMFLNPNTSKRRVQILQ